MEIQIEHQQHIKTLFAKMQTKNDFVSLLNEMNFILFGADSKSIPLKYISYFANPELSKKRYSTFRITKKSGGERIINSPNAGLKHILRTLNYILQIVGEAHHSAYGFVQDKSIVDNAKLHTNKHYVYNIDLKDFFHSFDRNRVKMGFIYPPFNLSEREPLAFMLASLCTHPIEIDGGIKTVLPQGSPTSPTLTNLLCIKLDRRLNGLAKKFNSKYSRYADDITFSAQINVFKDEAFQTELNRIIKDLNFEINPKKTRLLKSDFRQEVTGLTVNEQVNVKTKYVKQLRNWLYLWERYGFNHAETLFKKDYYSEKGHVKNQSPNFENVIGGKLEYLKMVKGFNNSTYLKLKDRFDKLMANSNPENNTLSTILSIWENDGIDSAIDFYDKNGGL